jgi:hypothetical protein
MSYSNTLPTTQDIEAAKEELLRTVNVPHLLDCYNEMRMDLDTAHQAILDLVARLATQAGLIAQLTQLVHLLVGGETVAASVTQLLTMMQANIASDKTTAADLLAEIGAVRVLAMGTATSVQLARTVADNALLATQTQASTLTDQGLKIAAATLLAQNALPLAGGTLMGPLNVMAPTAAANPAQLASMPLSMTFSQALPLVALGNLTSFTVTVAGAKPGNSALVNQPANFTMSGTLATAVVTAADKVTVTLKAGVAIAAGSQTFTLLVFR